MTRRFLLAAAGAPVLAQTDITSFGAKPGQDSRIAIQRAIDECAKRGGGTVRIPAGRFITGTVRLKSGVALWLDHGAVLAGSPDPALYEARRPTDRLPQHGWERALILAEGIEDAAISGHGSITGGGLAKPTVKGKPLESFRPRLISFERSRNVRVEGVTLRDADRWTLHFYDCDSVHAHDLRISARYDVTNTDGIDVDGCRNVVISGCEIVTGDDCIVLKTTNYLGEPRPCENVSISNCTLSTRASALKIGTETHADFANIAFSNCTVFGAGVYRPDAVCLEAVDGASLRGVAVTNIAMKHVRTPVFVRLGSRRALSSLDDVVISNIVAVDAEMASSITGIPARAATGVSVSNMRVVAAGGADRFAAEREIPEREGAYPSGGMFGPLPSHGFYIRHAQDVELRGISVSCEKPDARPVLIADDVTDLRINGLRSTAFVRLVNVQQTVVRGVRGRVEVSGSKSADINIVPEGGSLTTESSPEVPPGAVRSR